MSDAETEAILQKIANLKSLAEKPGTPGEAAAAIAAMQRLLFKYNLSMSDVKDKQESKFVNEVYGMDGNIKQTYNSWKGILMNTIAKNNFCKVVIVRLDSVAIVGREANVAIVKGMYEYLANEAFRQCKIAMKMQKILNGGASMLFRKSFFLGFINSVNVRLAEQSRESEREHGEKGSALVVQTKQEIERAYRTFYPFAHTGRNRSQNVSSDGFSAGKSAGQNVNLNRQVNSGSRLALVR